LLTFFHADQSLFQTGWFVESPATQVLVIFVIRTRQNPFASKPHPLLAATSIAVVGIALTLPFTALGHYFGLEPLPLQFFFIVGLLTLAYLGIVEIVKRVFYARLRVPASRRPGSRVRNVPSAYTSQPSQNESKRF
jgi:Mg2+-importing ATPase